MCLFQRCNLCKYHVNHQKLHVLTPFDNILRKCSHSEYPTLGFRVNRTRVSLLYISPNMGGRFHILTSDLGLRLRRLAISSFSIILSICSAKLVSSYGQMLCCSPGFSCGAAGGAASGRRHHRPPGAIRLFLVLQYYFGLRTDFEPKINARSF